MFLQGDLQAVFDALYTIGAIDPVLKMDWEIVTKEMESHPDRVYEACSVVNRCAGDVDALVRELHLMEKKSVHYIALEVAREFCEFQDRAESLH